MNGDASRGGVVVDTGCSWMLVTADVALRIVPETSVAHVPGGPRELLGVTLHEGALVPVLAIGASQGSMIVCEVVGELVVLSGAKVVRTGSFPPDPSAPGRVLVDGRSTEILDLRGLYDRVATHRADRRKGPPPSSKERVS
ncbi:MAG: hypothetical protein U0169_10410 [Polyangiaceae bacterium]